MQRPPAPTGHGLCPPHTETPFAPTHPAAQRGKQRLQAEDGDKKTEREKLLSELRALRDSARGPTNLEALEARIAEWVARAGGGHGVRGGMAGLHAVVQNAVLRRHLDPDFDGGVACSLARVCSWPDSSPCLPKRASPATRPIAAKPPPPARPSPQA
jgi:hypothetical protein